MALKTKETYEEKAESFFAKYGKKLVLVVILLVLASIGYSVAVKLTNDANAKDLDRIQVIENTVILNDESNTDGIKVADALAELEAYADKCNVVGVRANLLIAEIKYANKEYQAAAESYVKAAEADKSAYTAPGAYFNAAVCYESLETPDFEKSVEYYGKASEYEDYPKVDHALFSLGRANENKGDVEAAKKAYQKLADREDSFPEISPYDKPYVEGWAYMAKSRLITLSAN